MRDLFPGTRGLTGGDNKPYNMAKCVVEYSRQINRECLYNCSSQDRKESNGAGKKAKVAGKG